MWFDNPALKDIERINNLHKNIIKSPVSETMTAINQRQAVFQNMAGALTSPEFQSALAQANRINQIVSATEILKNIGVASLPATTIKSPVMEAIRSYTLSFSSANIAKKMFDSADVFRNYTSVVDRVMISPVVEALQSLTKFDYSILKTCNVDIDDVEICEDGISVNDETLTVQEIQENILDSVKELLAGIDVKNIGIAVKKKLSVFITFLEIILTLYGAVGMCNDINEHVITPIVREMHETEIIEYVKVERAYIREEPNSKSKTMCEILYAEPVEIIEEIKFWRKIKYCDNGKEIIGWISKISIGTEDEIK